MDHAGRADELLTADEGARDAARDARAWVYSETRRGAMPHVRLGRYVRFRRDALETWVRESSKALARQPTARRAADVGQGAAGQGDIMGGGREHGEAQLRDGAAYEKRGTYYGRWRTSDGRKLNRKLGAVRRAGESAGRTRTQAERRRRQIHEEEERPPRRPTTDPRATVADAADSLRRQLAVEGARTSYRQNCESMQRVHIAPRPGGTPIERVTTTDIEEPAASMLAAGRAPKTVRNVLTFLKRCRLAGDAASESRVRLVGHGFAQYIRANA